MTLSPRDRWLPWKIAGAVLAAALLLHAAAPRIWPWLLLGSIVGAAGALLVGERYGIKRQGYAAGAVGSGGAWLALSVAKGINFPRFLLLILGTAGFAVPWGRRRQAGRSKAHGITREQLKRAQAVENWLREEQQEWAGERWERFTRWERIAEQAGLTGSTVLRVEAVTAGFHFRVELAPGSTIDQARPAARSLESALDLRPGAIELEQDQERARVILLRVTPAKTVTAKPIPWPGPIPDAGILKPAQLGVYQDGGPLEAQLAYQHILIGGTTDAGKSGVVNIIVGYLAACPDVELRGIDLKGGAELGPWEDAMVQVVSNPRAAIPLLEQEQREMDRRYEEMAARKQRKWRPTSQAPARVTVIDEQRVLGEHKEAVKLLEDITGRGRAAMVTVLISTQYPTVDAIGSNLVANNCNVKIGLRVASSTEANVIFGKGMAGLGWVPHQIPPGVPGTLYLYAAEATTPRLARAFYASDAKVEQVAKRLARVVTPRAGQALIPPPGAVPNHDTETDELGQVGGGEVEGPHETLRQLLIHAGPDGISDRELVEQTGMSLPWVKKWRLHLGADQVERGYWRLP